MNRYLCLFLFCAAAVNPFAQDAATIAAQRESAEFERRMVSRMEELVQANNVQQRRINELREELATLRRQFVEQENRFKNSQMGAVTREDLQKVYGKMGEMEKARGSDKDVVLEQMRKLREIASQPAQPIIITQRVDNPRPPRDRENVRETPRDPEPVDEFTGEYYPYKIQKGDTLLGIIQAYNAQLKQEGKGSVTLEQVKKANPKLNPNSMVVGREIKIPAPSSK